MSSSEDLDKEVEGLDQIDLFHVQRGKSTLARYGPSQEHSSSDGDDGEEEVMPLDLSSSEASLSSTDQLDDERDLSVKAWGRNVAAYYKEGEEAREEEESLDGELEEREALQLQTAQATLLSQSDFDAQFPSGVGMDQSPLSDEDVMVAADLINMDASEKYLLVNRVHSELPHIVAGLKTALGVAVKGTSLMDRSTYSSHMKTYLQVSTLLNLSYSLNSMYYLLLKADRVGVASHPVTSTLLLLRKLLGRLERVHERQGSRADTQWKQQPLVSTLRSDETVSGEREEDPLSFYRKIVAQKKQKREGGTRLNTTFQEDLQPLEGKRAITYQISRNKGLGVSGRRQLRNPRVKHRLKYKKALLKRKSQVLPVARELTKYGGESTGIKADLSRTTVITS